MKKVGELNLSESGRTEESLRRSEERFQKIFNHSNDAIFIIDPSQDRILEANPKACQMLHYSREELLSTSISAVHPDEMPRLLAFAQTVFEQGSGWTDELSCLTKTGEALPAEISASVIEIGDKHCVIAMVREVTKRKRAEAALRKAKDELERRVEERTAQLLNANARLREEINERRKTEQALQESEARFRTLVEHAPEIILVLDADTGRFVDFNENAMRFFGLDRESLLKVGPIELSPPNSYLKGSEKIQEALDGGTPVFEWLHRNAAGEDIHCEVRLMRLPAAGRNLIRGSITNISEQKRAETALRRYAKRLEILQEIDRAILAAGSPEAIAQAALSHIRQLIPYLRASVMLWDDEVRDGVLCAVHARVEIKLGVGARLPLAAFGGEEIRQGKVHMVEDALSLPTTPFFEALKAEGLRSWINVPLISQGDLIGTLNLGWESPGAIDSEHLDIAREVADSLAIAIQQARLHEQVRHHATELEQRVAERTSELEAFSYSVSHDLRTPLLTIDGFSRVLLEDHSAKLGAEGERLLSIICANAQNMGQLIDDLLAFSRLGHQEMRPSEVNLSKLASAVFEELKAAAPERDLQFNLKPLPPAYGDAAMIRQVFVNLLSNAMKFTAPRETAFIEVGFGGEDIQNTYYVKDNGVGFDMKYADKLFGVFRRLHGGDKFPGTGVGLAFVQRIIQRHGGRVWAEAKAGEGAAIYFTLPKGPGKT